MTPEEEEAHRVYAAHRAIMQQELWTAGWSQLGPVTWKAPDGHIEYGGIDVIWLRYRDELEGRQS